jgi:hypothetical protein
MASLKTIPYQTGRGDIYIIGECQGRHEFGRIENISVWEKTEPKHKESSRQTPKGDTTMHNYEFGFRGGAKKLDQANYKFHVFVADSNATEHHVYGALKNGLIEHKEAAHSLYSSATPVLKVFSATAGFGVPKEFFSYFIMLSTSTSRVINIKPLGFKKLEGANWFFSGRGRFMAKEEIRRFFGSTSDTWKFFQRQSFLSRHRLQELVTITEGETVPEPVVETDEVRLLRFD